jgi:hypothetical protein
MSAPRCDAESRVQCYMTEVSPRRSTDVSAELLDKKPPATLVTAVRPLRSTVVSDGLKVLPDQNSGFVSVASSRWTDGVVPGNADMIGEFRKGGTESPLVFQRCCTVSATASVWDGGGLGGSSLSPQDTIDLSHSRIVLQVCPSSPLRCLSYSYTVQLQTGE